jgi:CBS domain-containing protein
VAENADVAETVKLKETYGMRRVTVVDEAGGLVGVVSLADLQGVLSS